MLPLLALVFALALPGCRNGAASDSPSTEATAQTPTPLKAFTVQFQPWPRTIRVQGSLSADEYGIVGAKVAGRVEQVKVDLGSTVAANDILATLETEDFSLKQAQAKADLAQALAKLGLGPDDNEDRLDRYQVPSVLQEEALRNEARSNLNRAASLISLKIISTEELQQRQAAYDVAQAKYRSALNAVDEQLALLKVRRSELAQVQQALKDCVIRAPFAGVIQQRDVAPGNYVQVGQSVIALVRLDPLRFRAGVPERDAIQLAPQQKAEIRVEGLAVTQSAAVSRISPALDLASRALTVEIDLPNPGNRLRVGLFAEADIVVDPAAQALAVPASAVHEFAGVEKVWVLHEGAAREQTVRTGRRQNGRFEILGGLQAGQVIALEARALKRSGPVLVQPEPAAVAKQAG